MCSLQFILESPGFSGLLGNALGLSGVSGGGPANMTTALGSMTSHGAGGAGNTGGTGNTGTSRQVFVRNVSDIFWEF